MEFSNKIICKSDGFNELDDNIKLDLLIYFIYDGSITISDLQEVVKFIRFRKIAETN